MCVNIIMLALGIALSSVQFTVLLSFFSTELIVVSKIELILASIGVTLFCTGVINLVILAVDKGQEDKINMATEMALEILKTCTNVRRNQNITITFNEDGDKIIADITHSFYYNDENKEGKNCSVVIFSDFQGEKETITSTSTPKFYFKEVHGEDEVLIWQAESHRKRLYTIKNGKLWIKLNSKFPAKSSTNKEFKFVICNQYNTNDRLFWTFQEMSAGDVTIKIDCRNLTCNRRFYFRIDHHSIEQIITNHNKSIKKDSKSNAKINPTTGLIEGNYLDLKISENILPYQGFEISWIKND